MNELKDVEVKLSDHERSASESIAEIVSVFVMTAPPSVHFIT